MGTKNEPSMREIWTPIPCYEGFYDVSNHGRVRSNYGDTATILKCTPDRDGYVRVGLHKYGVPKTFTIHSLVMASFVGPRAGGMETNHKDGNKSNNHITNIEYVTNQENVDHAVMMGLHVRGEMVGGSKLTESDVLDIWTSLSSEPRRSIAKRHNVSVRHIGHIATRKKWAWLTGPLAASDA